MPTRILVIEDNEDNLTPIDVLLRAHGHNPVLARNGTDGIRIAVEERPEMILLDIRMPGMDGFQVAAALRQEATLSSISTSADANGRRTRPNSSRSQ